MANPESFHPPEQQGGGEFDQVYENELRDWREYLAENNLTQLEATVMDVTSKCDYGKCPACYYMDDEAVRCPNQDLDLKTVDAWKKVFLESGVIPHEVWLPGGEPTVNPNLIQIINSLKEIVPVVTMPSNGFNLANPKFTKKLLSESRLDEIDITINGANPDIHNLMMATIDNPVWRSVPNLPFNELLKGYFNGQVNMNNFNRTYHSLLNLAQISAQLNRDLIIGLNLNVNQGVDLLSLINRLEKDGGRVDYPMLQIRQPTTRSLGKEAGNRSFEWQEPTVEMIRGYLSQARQLIKEGRIEDAAIIDPLPHEIVTALDLNNEPLYRPSDVPAIGVDGKLRTNVLS